MRSSAGHFNPERVGTELKGELRLLGASEVTGGDLSKVALDSKGTFQI